MRVRERTEGAEEGITVRNQIPTTMKSDRAILDSTSAGKKSKRSQKGVDLVSTKRLPWKKRGVRIGERKEKNFENNSSELSCLNNQGGEILRKSQHCRRKKGNGEIHKENRKRRANRNRKWQNENDRSFHLTTVRCAMTPLRLGDDRNGLSGKGTSAR